MDLVRAGYLPVSPVNPTVALSIRTLELYHSLQRSVSSFSAQSFARLLSDMLKVQDLFLPSTDTHDLQDSV